MDCVVFNATSIVTVFENSEGSSDIKQVSPGESGRLRYGVLNESHRWDIKVDFETEITRGSLVCRHGSSTTHSLIAYRRLHRKRKHPPSTAIMYVEVVRNPNIPEEVLITKLTSTKTMPDTAPKNNKELRNIVIIDLGRQKGAHMSTDYLKAIGKAVVTLAGPFGAPLEGLLVLYDSQEQKKKDEINNEIHQLVSSSHQISKESLSTLLQLEHDLKHTMDNFVALFYLIINDLRADPTTPLENSVSSTLTRLSQQNPAIDCVTEKRVTDELRHLFADNVDNFKAIIKNAGFPNETFPVGLSAYAIYVEFPRACRGQSPTLIYNVFNSLRNERPGSKILNNVTEMFQEYATFQ